MNTHNTVWDNDAYVTSNHLSSFKYCKFSMKWNGHVIFPSCSHTEGKGEVLEIQIGYLTLRHSGVTYVSVLMP